MQEPKYTYEQGELYCGDVLEQLGYLDDGSVDCVVTSPPYFGLRDYGMDGQIGLEKTPQDFVESMVRVFREIHRVLKDDGTVWLNLGDSYNGSGGAGGDYNKGGLKEGQPRYKGRNVPSLKRKDLIGIPWRVAFALQDDGWYLRQDIIWHKPNPMPESVRDRCTKAHEYIFLLTKKPKYFFDNVAIKEPAKNWGTRNRDNMRNGTKDPKLKHHGLKGKEWEENPKRNKRSVWFMATRSYKGAHFATFPPKLIEPCILAGCPEDGVVLDPFIGSGTTAVVAMQNNRRFIGIDLNPEYLKLADDRIRSEMVNIKEA